MNRLKLLENIGFKISWRLISIGLYGYDEIPVLLTHDDVIDYLESLLTNTREATDNIISLICEKDNLVQFDRLLKEFVNDDESDITIQKRKWRAYLLKDLLNNINKDWLQGLLELMEFWISMGKPDDCPQTFPNGNDKVSIQNYFAQTSFMFFVEKNYAWLNKEVSTIIKLDI